mmetsp:Transcript_6651/g.16258  ORF Transcript_6651/g.16258 Transcript_6651/m.16258 type:complete len:240 (-) Transcript_6651:385-1104(-)
MLRCNAVSLKHVPLKPPLAAELAQLLVSLGVVTEEEILILGIHIEEDLETVVLVKDFVSRHPEQIVCVLTALEVRVIEAEPVLRPRFAACHANPILFVRSRLVERAGELRGRLSPVAVVDDPAPFLERAAEGVGTGEGDDLPVVEAHAVEHVPQVAGGIGGTVPERRVCVGEVPLLRALLLRLRVETAVPHRDNRPSGVLDRSGTAELDQVRPGHVRVLLLDALQIVHGLHKTGVGAVA